MDWKNVNDELPKETNTYLVTRNSITSHSTFANYVLLTEKWMVLVSGIFWEIKGVQYWREKPLQPGKN